MHLLSARLARLSSQLLPAASSNIANSWGQIKIKGEIKIETFGERQL